MSETAQARTKANSLRQRLELMAVQLRLAGWAAIVAIAVVSLVPGQLRPHVLSANTSEHFLAYLAVGALLAVAYQGHASAILIGLCLMAYAALLEIGQLFVPERGASVVHFAWSSFGAWCGVALACFGIWIAGRLWRSGSDSDVSE